MRSRFKYLGLLTVVLLLCNSCQPSLEDATLTQAPRNSALDSNNPTVETSNNKIDAGAALVKRGDVYRQMGRNDEALKSYQQALDIFNEVLKISSNKSDLGTALVNIGDVYYKLDRHDEALRSYQQALDIFNELGNTSVAQDTHKKIKTLQ